MFLGLRGAFVQAHFSADRETELGAVSLARIEKNEEKCLDLLTANIYIF